MRVRPCVRVHVCEGRYEKITKQKHTPTPLNNLAVACIFYTHNFLKKSPPYPHQSVGPAIPI